jgi:hypothetical protein
MKSVRIFKVLLLVTIAIFSSASQAQQKKPPDLNGIWNLDDGGVVKVTQSGSSLTATFVSGGDCPFGAPPRTTYISGQLRNPSSDGTTYSLDGTAYFCTRTKVLYDCGFGNFTSSVHGIVREKRITLTYNSEYYRDDGKKDFPKVGESGNDSEDKKCPHSWVRDPSGDSEKKKTLTRSNCDPANGIPCIGNRPPAGKPTTGGKPPNKDQPDSSDSGDTEPSESSSCKTGDRPLTTDDAAAITQLVFSLQKDIDSLTKQLRVVRAGRQGAAIKDRINKLQHMKAFWQSVRAESCVQPGVIAAISSYLEAKKGSSNAQAACQNLCSVTSLWVQGLAGSPLQQMFSQDSCAAQCK